MKKEKVDVGKEFFYWNLSYRRRLIRDLFIGVPFYIILIIYEVIGSSLKKSDIILIFGMSILVILVFVYNFTRWRLEIKNKKVSK